MVAPKLQWMTPMAPSCQYCYLLDKVHFRVGTQQEDNITVRPDDTSVELWTDLYHKENNEGEWHAVPMKYLAIQSKRDNGFVIYFYGVDLIITCLGCYNFTFRLRHRNETEYIWASWMHVNGKLEVRTPISELTTWILEPQTSQITHNIYIGNYTAALEAPERGFDCVLNVADNASVFPQQLSDYIIFKKYLIPTGCNVIISEDLIWDAVEWLRAMSNCCNKIMVVSRNGRGRAGSIMISFIFAMNPDLSFEEAYKFVDNRHFVYYNKGLKNALYGMYPRHVKCEYFEDLRKIPSEMIS